MAAAPAEVLVEQRSPVLLVASNRCDDADPNDGCGELEHGDDDSGDSGSGTCKVCVSLCAVLLLAVAGGCSSCRCRRWC